MKRLLHLLIGITVFSVNSDEHLHLINLANKNNIFLLDAKKYENKVVIKIFTKEEKRLFLILNSEGIDFVLIKRKGVKKLIKKYKHRIGMWVGLILFFVTLYLSPQLIWEINISGIDKLSEEYIVSVLENEGVYIGAFQPQIDRKRAYMNIISQYPDISWISVNFIGSSANVEVIERDYAEIAEITSDAANIVASKDGQISDLKVLNGKSIVKIGDTVKKGDILISGVYDSSMMGTKYVNASGEVYANVTECFYVEVPLKHTKREYTDEIVIERDINILGKSIKFYKNYSHLDENYDTIKKEHNFKKSDMKVLPVYSTDTVALIYSDVEIVYSEEEALNDARSRFFSFIDTEKDYCDIISYDECYEIKNGILLYSAEVNAIENIAMISKVNIE